MIAAQELGHRVQQVFVIHLNGDYVRNGEIAPEALLGSGPIDLNVAA